MMRRQSWRNSDIWRTRARIMRSSSFRKKYAMSNRWLTRSQELPVLPAELRYSAISSEADRRLRPTVSWLPVWVPRRWNCWWLASAGIASASATTRSFRCRSKNASRCREAAVRHSTDYLTGSSKGYASILFSFEKPCFSGLSLFWKHRCDSI